MTPTSVGSFQSVGDDRTLPPVSIALGRVAGHAESVLKKVS
jgi:hypothetical protein